MMAFCTPPPSTAATARANTSPGNARNISEIRIFDYQPSRSGDCAKKFLGGRAAILTFHSGEDRIVKKAFQALHRAGVYADIANGVIRRGCGDASR